MKECLKFEVKLYKNFEFENNFFLQKNLYDIREKLYNKPYMYILLLPVQYTEMTH